MNFAHCRLSDTLGVNSVHMTDGADDECIVASVLLLIKDDGSFVLWNYLPQPDQPGHFF